jgi:hypothetical protein
MKTTILPLGIALLTAISSAAQTETLRIELNDGTIQSIPVTDIKEMTFGQEETDPTEMFTGEFSGVNTVVVGGMFTYKADITYDIRKAENGTLTVNIPEYSLAGTVMGDLTLGAYSIEGLEYDEETDSFSRDYSNDGLSMHFTAVQNGTTNMDKDYAFNPGSQITVEKAEAGIKVTNRFKMGAMPFEIVATFEGSK